MKTRPWLVVMAGMAGTILFIFFFGCLTFFFIPDKTLQGLTAGFFEQQGYAFRSAKFSKSFPLGVKVEEIDVASQKGLLLRVKEAKLHLRLFPLIFGQAVFTAEAAIGAGQCKVRFSSKDQEICVKASGIRLEELPFFLTMTGVRVKGNMDLTGCLKGKGEGGGEWRLEVKKAEITGVKIGDLLLPEADQAVIQAMVRKKRGGLRLESLTIQREGLYCRLKAELMLGYPVALVPINLTLELMPQREFLDQQKGAFLLLTKYLITPGYYRIPIRGTLSHPSVQ